MAATAIGRCARGDRRLAGRDATLEPQRRGAADGVDRPLTDRSNDGGCLYRWCEARLRGLKIHTSLLSIVLHD
jgi:hypothetical protein